MLAGVVIQRQWQDSADASMTDALTGLPNLVLGIDLPGAECPERFAQRQLILLIDADQFKSYNDQLWTPHLWAIHQHNGALNQPRMSPPQELVPFPPPEADRNRIDSAARIRANMAAPQY
jgi:hypothetical protein